MENLSRPRERFYGLYTSIPDVLRGADAAADTLNTYVSRAGTLTTRPGYKAEFKATAGCGAAQYKRVATDDGATTYEKLFMGQQLYKVATGTLAMTYSGAATSVVCAVVYDTSALEWKFYLYEDDVAIFTYSLGKGFDETSPVTLTTLTAAIDALSTFAATNTGSGSLPAAFLPSVLFEPFASNALTISYEYESVITQPTSAANPFVNHLAHRNDVDFEMISTVNINNVIYFTSPWDEEKKYDGQKVYRSGMPKPGTPTAAAVPNATGRTGTNIRYRVAFVQYDKQNNRVEGIISDESGTVSPAADFVDVTYATLATNSGFNTDFAIVNGAQVAVTTITVDNGAAGNHTLKVGDVAYFYDSVSASYVTRTITAVTGTTLTISGAAVTVADNAPISANLRVALYGQSVASGDYYYIGEFPHDPSAGTAVVRDDGTVTLTSPYVFPAPGTEPGLPPKGKYSAVFKGVKFVAVQPDTIAFSDILSPEYYPPLSNTFTIRTGAQEALAGFFTTSEFFLIFKKNSTHILTADINEETQQFRYRIDELSLSVGCASHHSIRQLDDGSVVWLSNNGIYRQRGAGAPQRVSEFVSPIFSKRETGESALVLKRAWAVYSSIDNWYLIFIPAESLNGSDRYSNDNSKLLLLDFANSFTANIANQNTELPVITLWDNCNFTCGAFCEDRDLYFIERRFSDFDAAITYKLHKFMRTDTDYDWLDHWEVIQSTWLTGWEVPIDRSTFVLPTRLKIFSNDPERASSFDLEVGMQINFNPSTIATLNYNFGATGSDGYSYATYSTAPYGSPTEPELEARLPPVKASSFRYSFTVAEHYRGFLVTGWETEISTPFRKAMNE